MQQSKAFVIKNATQRLAERACNLKATMAARKAEYAAYRYGNDYQPQRQQRPTREERTATNGN